LNIDGCVIVLTVFNEEAKELSQKKFTEVKPYLRLIPHLD